MRKAEQEGDPRKKWWQEGHESLNKKEIKSLTSSICENVEYNFGTKKIDRNTG